MMSVAGIVPPLTSPTRSALHNNRVPSTRLNISLGGRKQVSSENTALLTMCARCNLPFRAQPAPAYGPMIMVVK